MRRKPTFSERRVLLKQEAAVYLGRSTSWLDDNAGKLQETGFPRPLPVVGGYDRKAIDQWLDRLGGQMHDTEDFDDAWMRAANG